MITRRLFAGMLPGAAASAPSIFKSAVQAAEMSIQSTPAVSDWGHTETSAGFTINKPSEPRMNYEAALETARKLPWMKDKLRDYYRQSAQNVTRIDYDILIKKSWSDMYKVTVQIERNLEKLVNQELSFGRVIHDSPLHSFLNELMWGKK